MPQPKLSDRTIRDLKPVPRNTLLAAGVKGLYLRVSPTGSKTFVLRQQRGMLVEGRRLVVNRLIRLGKYPGMTLADAQRAALSMRGERQPNATATVRDLVERFYSARIVPGHKRPEQTRHYLDRDLLASHIADLELRKVSRSHLAGIIERKALESGPVAANRLLAIVKRAFAYGVTFGLLQESPAVPLDRSIAGGTEEARDRVLTDPEIGLLWGIDATTCDHAALLRFLLLSGQRISEARDAAWAHFDLQAGVWRIDDNKSSRPHRVPISAAMRAIIEGQPRVRYGDATVGPFATASTTAAQAWLKRWCTRNHIVPSFTPHDLRRTFATRLRNDLGVSFDVVEKILNHAPLTKVAGIYQRGDLWQQRVNAMNAWAAHVEHIIGGAAAPVVTMLGRARI